MIQVKRHPELIKTLTHHRGVSKYFALPSTLYKHHLWKHSVCYFSFSYTWYFKCFKLVFLLIFLGTTPYSVQSQGITNLSCSYIILLFLCCHQINEKSTLAREYELGNFYNKDPGVTLKYFTMEKGKIFTKS